MSDAGGLNFAGLADGVLQRARSRLASGFHDVEGVGEAANGRVRATVTTGGRLRDLTVDPHLIRSRDPESVVDAIKSAVNRAADDLQVRLRESSDRRAGGVAAELDDVVAGLDRLLDQISTDIARARSSHG